MQSVYSGAYSPAAMFGALRVTDEIDLTGIATVVLALATAGLAWWTRRAVDQSATEVERAHRPVLVPIIDTLQRIPMPGNQRYTDTQGAIRDALELAPQYVASWDALLVPVRNVGMGPALHVKASVEMRDAGGAPSASAIDSTFQTRVAALGHAERFEVVRFLVPTYSGLTGFELRVSYEDVAGKRWQTTALYSHDDREYVNVKVTEDN
jgi:hypothetical protein